ncbi:type 4a pilus biogenesis protein PilO [Candidatus Falkowbacteria bacterium]|nr:type 4a pilus biogenesis protein PilO [Candidatus Falkowbacteria bacterium]
MRIKTIFAIVILLVSAFVIWQYVLPLYREIKTARAEAGRKQQKIQSLNVFAQQLEGLKWRYMENKESIERLYKILPDTKDTAGFLNNIDYLSFQSGMILGAISFAEQHREGGAAAPPLDDKAQLTVHEAGIPITFGSILINVSTTGTYESFKSLLAGLEKNIRLTDIQSISFVSKGESANIFEFKIAAKIYYKE